MATELAAYDAAPLPPPSPAPLAVYLVSDGVPTEIVGIHDFDITVENPASEDADATELDITLDYDPSNPEHRALMAAGEGGMVTMRVATRDPHGAAIACREMDCTVVRYRLSMDERFREDTKRLRVNFDLEAVGEVRTIG
jgi:hypothetical protein